MRNQSRALMELWVWLKTGVVQTCTKLPIRSTISDWRGSYQIFSLTMIIFDIKFKEVSLLFLHPIFNFIFHVLAHDQSIWLCHMFAVSHLPNKIRSLGDQWSNRLYLTHSLTCFTIFTFSVFLRLSLELKLTSYCTIYTPIGHTVKTTYIVVVHRVPRWDTVLTLCLSVCF